MRISDWSSDVCSSDLLFEAIDAGDFPAWDLGVQLFDEAFAAKQPYDVLDATKLIPEEDIPVEIIGRMTLNRNVDNFFAERSEEHTSELQSLMRISYAGFCLKQKTIKITKDR